MKEDLLAYYESILSVKDNIQDNIVYFESHGGTDLAGNMFYMVEQFLKENEKYEVVIVVDNKEKLPNNVRLLLLEFGSDRIKVVEKDTCEHITYIATARYLLTDVQFSSFYIKREGQVCVQTWHGTPLKKLGFDFVDDVFCTGGQKKSFIDADIVLHPNKYTKDNMNESYRLHYYANSDYIMGYPRNSIFFDEDRKLKVKNLERLQNKKTYAYMPTWRGSLNGMTNNQKQIEIFLNKMEEVLNDEEIMYVKLHRLMRENIDFSKYYRIKEFPKEFETYEFLAVADCLITDYSSVMFDFLCTRKKVILYMYDKAEYLNKQGTYIEIDKLPFSKVENLDDLVMELRKNKDYDDTDAYDYFCKMDGMDAPHKLYSLMLQKRQEKIKGEKKGEKVKRYLFWGGDLSPSIHTMEFVDIVDAVIDKGNIGVSVAYKNLDCINNPMRIQVFPKPVDLISIDYINNDLLLNSNEHENDKKWELINQAQLHGNHFDKVICYVDKYDEVLDLFANSKSDVTFVLDKNISDDDKEKISYLARSRKVSLVDKISAVKI